MGTEALLQLNTNINKELLAKYSNQAVQAVACQSGKSLFEDMTQTVFSEFLYAIMRYKNLELFSRLATILEPSKELIEEFWDGVFYELYPDRIIAGTICKLLKAKPEGWNLEIFRYYMNKCYDRADEIQRSDPYVEKKYGKPALSAYLLHANTEFFSNSLKDENLSAKEWRKIVNDWKDAASSTRSKNHHLRNHILRKIIDAGALIILRDITKLQKLGKKYEEANMGLQSRDPELYDICYEINMIIWGEFNSLLSSESDYHSFSPEEYLYILNKYLSYYSFLNSSNLGMCKSYGRILFNDGLWKQINPNATDVPPALKEMANVWADAARMRTFEDIMKV